MQKLLILFIALCMGISLLMGAQAGHKPVVRRFDQKKLTELRADPDLQYHTGPAGQSIWQRFWLSFLQWAERLRMGFAEANWTRILLMGLIVLTLIVVIMRLFHLDSPAIFYRNSSPTPAHQAVEDLGHDDLEVLIAEALQRKDHRLAIRLQFLQLLQLLSEHHIIRWQPGKTSHAYLNEIDAGDLRENLALVNRIFEFTWYGNFPAPPHLYARVADAYQQCRTRLKAS
jgi:hypothetical protein